MQTFLHRAYVPEPISSVYRWFTLPGAIERLIPPWEPVRLLHRSGSFDNLRVELGLHLGALRSRWVARHHHVEPEREFWDTQESGPFASWNHRHRFTPVSDAETVVEDHIEYRLPAGILGQMLGGRVVRQRLQKMFDYRHRMLVADLADHRSARQKVGSMDVLVVGASGLIGSSLVPFLTSGGHRVRRLGRPRRNVSNDARADDAATETFSWDPEAGSVDPQALDGVRAVVHLAGENVGSRWSERKKRGIRMSRVAGTRLLCQRLAAMPDPPHTLVCASGVGFYGDRGDESLTEESAPGTGFLADVCREWEEATEPARSRGVRVVNLRFGVVLTPAGGSLARVLLPFRLGLGGRLGSGRQYMSWVSIDDAVGAIHHALIDDGLRDAVNVSAPQPVTNAVFTKTLGRVLGRPTLLPAPAAALRVAFGEMADGLLLSSIRAMPEKLQQSGYEFRHPDLETALRHLLGCMVS